MYAMRGRSEITGGNGGTGAERTALLLQKDYFVCNASAQVSPETHSRGQRRQRICEGFTASEPICEEQRKEKQKLSPNFLLEAMWLIVSAAEKTTECRCHGFPACVSPDCMFKFHPIWDGIKRP